MALTGRMLAELAEVALRDAAAAIDPHHTDDDHDGSAPLRTITFEDLEESVRLSSIGAELELRAGFAGFPFGCDDPFDSDEERERRRCEAWDRVLP